MINLIAKLFGGKIKTAIASGIVWITLYIVAQVAKLDPQLSSVIDPNAVANFLAAAFFSIVNIIANDKHLTNNSTLETVIAALQSEGKPDVQIPIKKAEILK